jgi:hypothetical protein
MTEVTRHSLSDLEADIRAKRPKGHHIGVAVDGSEMSERAGRECQLSIGSCTPFLYKNTKL